MKTIITAALIAFAPFAFAEPSAEEYVALGELMGLVAEARDAGLPFSDTVSAIREGTPNESVIGIAARVYLVPDVPPAEVERRVVLACLGGQSA